MNIFVYVAAVAVMLSTIPISFYYSKKSSQDNDESGIHPLNKDRSFVFFLCFSFLLSITMSCVIFIEAAVSGKYTVGLSGESFLRAFELFKAPISILGAGFAVAALIAAIHRSKETNVQIISANNKNNFDNYIKHIDFFEDKVLAFIDKELTPVIYRKLRQQGISLDGKYKPYTYENMKCYRVFFPLCFFNNIDISLSSTDYLRVKSEIDSISDAIELLEHFGIKITIRELDNYYGAPVDDFAALISNEINEFSRKLSVFVSNEFSLNKIVSC